MQERRRVAPPPFVWPSSVASAARRVGLDDAQWEKDMNSPAIADQITAEMKEATAAEVRGTPTIFVNGKRVQNRSVEGFKTMIDEAKAKG